MGSAGHVHVWARYGDTFSTAIGDIPLYWWVVGLSNAALLFISTSSMLLAFGLWLPLHPKIYIFGMFALLVHFTLAIWDAKQGWSLRVLWAAYGYLASVAIVCCSIFALKKALSAGFLGKRLFGCACCLWLTYVTSTIALYIKATPTIEIPLAALALGATLLLVPLSATAIAPLALASHRHA